MRVQLPSKCLASPPIFLHLSQTVKLVKFLFFGHRLSWFSSLFGFNSNQLNSSNSSLPKSITLLPVKTMLRHTNIQLLKKLRTQSTVTVTLCESNKIEDFCSKKDKLLLFMSPSKRSEGLIYYGNHKIIQITVYCILRAACPKEWSVIY